MANKFTKNSQRGIDLDTILQLPDNSYIWVMHDGKDYKINASLLKTVIINSGGGTFATYTDLALKLDKIGGVIEKPHLGGGLETILAIKIDNSTNNIAFANGTSVNGVFVPCLVATVDTTGITGVGGINGNVPGGFWLTKVNDASNLTEPAYRFDARDLSNQALEYRPLFGFGSANGDVMRLYTDRLSLIDNNITDVKELQFSNDITFTDEQKNAMPVGATFYDVENDCISKKNADNTIHHILEAENNLSDLANRQISVNNLFDATNLETGQTLIKDENGNMVAGNAGGGASQDSIEFPVPTDYTCTGDYITKVVETIEGGTIEKRLRYYISASQIVDGSPDIMEYKNSVTNFWSRATYNYTAGKLTSITTETINAWTI